MLRNFLKSRRTSFLFIVGVAVLGGLLAVKVMFFPQTPRESAAPSSAAAAPSLSAVASSSASVGADGRAVCDVKVPAGKEFSAEVPEDYVWAATSDGARYPVSAVYGPTVQVGHTGQCFAHNPTGAAMAAIAALHAQSDSQAPESERRALLSKHLAGEPLDAPQPKKVDTQVFGFEIQGYSPDRATVKIDLLSQKVVARIAVRVVWEDGDWRFDSSESELTPQIVTEKGDLARQIFRVKGV
jgi:hypothetical protein